MKTNKTVMKRVRVSKNGIVQVRAKGHDHFNAKERRRRQLGKKRMVGFTFTNKSKSRYLTF